MNMNPQLVLCNPRCEFILFLLLIPLVISRNDEEIIKHNFMSAEQLFCPEVQDSIQNVTSCPRNEAEWFTAGKRKNCSKGTKGCTDELVYHCVPNHYQNKTVEVCAPLKLIVFGHCPEYSFLGRRVQENYNTDCTQFDVPCPLFYKSNEVYKYQGCYDVFESTNSKNVSWSLIESRIKDTESIIPQDRIHSSRNVPNEKRDDIITIVLPLVCSLAAMVMCLFFIWIWWRRIQRTSRVMSCITTNTLRKTTRDELTRQDYLSC
ncbi:uncharacterized protein LOC125677135 isoform X2 [Ostrea edulis]|uniref:uncharacterized protein LOC125677135 isoform X2 n=1 Tax=Ostrea edulis TaxID=37623 RepID=UPI0024AF2849|nr:uncharacterized protein LOC125677135 isoform X2 [Ostrea edulis]XP_056013694.1 uncharacterized protein LOC125677135 isoform X2 [Ostrea edulis]XP_056013695.1 uncharacterized protein LOC125677135 isoform X2 [Ostrea edulis]XP_056013697.1 uncharacterized protein LOC125677135 isoform X2 [Ostrea edulis]